MYESKSLIALSVILCLFCTCSLSIKAHDGEEHETLTANSLDGVWNVRQKLSLCLDPGNGGDLQANLKFHAGHLSPEIPSKLILSFCTDESGNLMGFMKNQNRLDDLDIKYEVTELNIDDGNDTFYITSQSDNFNELGIEIINLEEKSLYVSFASEFDGFGCFYRAKKIKAKPSRACKNLLNAN